MQVIIYITNSNWY